MTSEEHEEAFCKAFIRSERRERYLYMLASGKRRARLRRRYVNLSRDLDPRLASPVPSDYSFADIESYLRAHGAGDACHVMSSDDELDGMTLPLSSALDKTSFGLGSVLSCLPGRLAYAVGEFGDNKLFLERTDHP